jgi:hypothetical protein
MKLKLFNIKHLKFNIKHLALIIILALVACQGNHKKDSEKLSREEVKARMDSLRKARLAKQLLNTSLDSTTLDSLNRHKTTLKFEQEVYDFGEVKEGIVLNEKVIYTNTGENPLVIIAAFGSCGCTIPTFSKEPLAPGASDTIAVSFNSEGRRGNQSKAVTVMANTEPPANVFKFTVKVK